MERKRAGLTLTSLPGLMDHDLALARSFWAGEGAGVEKEEDKEPGEAGMTSFYTSTRRLRR